MTGKRPATGQTQTERFVDCVLGIRYEDLPPEAIEVSKQVMLDGLGVTVAGADEPSGIGRIAKQYAQDMGGVPESTVITGGFKTAMSMAAFVNGGNYVPPTFYKRTPEQAEALYRRVVSPQTSLKLRELMRLNALEGSGTRMNMWADGCRAGGKTGTAEKVIDGRYSNKDFNVFASSFPLDDPKYAMVVLVDEPHRENAQSGTTAGWNAGEVTGRIIARVAPMLGVAPNFDEMIDERLVPPAIR